MTQSKKLNLRTDLKYIVLRTGKSNERVTKGEFTLQNGLKSGAKTCATLNTVG